MIERVQRIVLQDYSVNIRLENNIISLPVLQTELYVTGTARRFFCLMTYGKERKTLKV